MPKKRAYGDAGSRKKKKKSNTWERSAFEVAAEALDGKAAEDPTPIRRGPRFTMEKQDKLRRVSRREEEKREQRRFVARFSKKNKQLSKQGWRALRDRVREKEMSRSARASFTGAPSDEGDPSSGESGSEDTDAEEPGSAFDALVQSLDARGDGRTLAAHRALLEERRLEQEGALSDEEEAAALADPPGAEEVAHGQNDDGEGGDADADEASGRATGRRAILEDADGEDANVVAADGADYSDEESGENTGQGDEDHRRCAALYATLVAADPLSPAAMEELAAGAQRPAYEKPRSRRGGFDADSRGAAVELSERTWPAGEGGRAARRQKGHALDPLVAPHLSKANEACNAGGALLPFQRWLLSSLQTYRDVLVGARYRREPRAKGGRAAAVSAHGLRVGVPHGLAADATRPVVCAHVLTHLLRARRQTLRHNARIRRDAETKRAARREKKEQEKASGTAPKKRLRGVDLEDADDAEGAWRRDQGFCRPRGLILAPTRNVAYQMVATLCGLLGRDAHVAGLRRFEEEFGPGEELDGDELSLARQKAERKGAEWCEFFGPEVNADDDFRIGIAITPGRAGGRGVAHRTRVELFSDFYGSDLVVASPLGLRLLLERDGSSDFLSSIELCVAADCDVMLQQNWEHVRSAFEALNQRPSEDRGTDFSRVREYFLQEQGRAFRQTIMLSCHADARLSALFHSPLVACRLGKVRFDERFPDGAEALASVAVPALRMVFRRIDCAAAVEAPQARLDYFMSKVLPSLDRHACIVVPDYLEFVLLRNRLKRDGERTFVMVHEYARQSEVSRSRSRFFHGQRELMLITGRALFYQRHRIRGVARLVFFGLPVRAAQYPWMANVLEERLVDSSRGAEGDSKTPAGDASCLALYTRYEALALQRIVGDKRTATMLNSGQHTFMYV